MTLALWPGRGMSSAPSSSTSSARVATVQATVSERHAALEQARCRMLVQTRCVMLAQLLSWGFMNGALRGRAGGLEGGPKGGRARARALSPERRREIARRASAARWDGQLPEVVRSLFWEYRFEDLRLADHRDLLLTKVLTYGGPKEVQWLRRRLGDAAIKTWIYEREGRGLTIAQMRRWVPERTARSWQRRSAGAQIWEQR